MARARVVGQRGGSRYISACFARAIEYLLVCAPHYATLDCVCEPCARVPSPCDREVSGSSRVADPRCARLAVAQTAMWPNAAPGLFSARLLVLRNAGDRCTPTRPVPDVRRRQDASRHGGDRDLRPREAPSTGGGTPLAYVRSALWGHWADGCLGVRAGGGLSELEALCEPVSCVYFWALFFSLSCESCT